ncbi:hypothetical protein SS1G_09973 [Sclerotinia sclerotiorum 1980 UF-70]|uniref:Mob1/phocein family protein n=2 Tax=Sclerotinia sclerotiorum (strain ATCC 18683 / 1980 / Ss-1) TaxID=665079 RepID=A0A1D9PTC8_SCLS1|nr:hypothetical protein SS1G_09973 [Sclerotinia sclerotiorum 1980 UF-70]APA05523.1 hypothetical protein sscle_01g002930 [Sclerotinia sclerotiorum 1980 UF-70]EDN94104.1 hypothetical protein SS1G_09973 [Sclerotinia sclerotiorum 1980 UF-70]
MSTLPPSSPRLPSPPPPTEIQIGPKSPSLGSAPSSQEQMIEQSIIETNAIRRIHPGTKAADMAAGPPLIPLSELDSAFQLQEHLKALHYFHTKPPSKDHSVPITRETAVEIATPPNGLDQALWLYELCRFLINKCNDLIIGFLFDDPPCSAHTCPEMRASEWQFLCAVHESPKSCCAIDYCCHTLDWATNIVTSQKIFPSRLSMAAGDAMDDRGAGVKHLINIFRRLHRIFAHAWFQHRGVFWQVEGQTGLYVLFKTVCDMHELLPPENYKLPPEAEGLENVEDKPPTVTSILKTPVGVEEDFLGLGRQNTTRRHVRQSPSVGSAITTVQEIDEEEGNITQRLRIARNSRIAEEEGEDGGAESDTGTEIPVIVETFEEVDPDHDMEIEKLKDGISKEEEPSSEMIEELELEQEDSETVIHDDDSKADSTGSWDSMSGDSLGDKTEVKQENDDTGEEKAEPVVKEPVTELKPGAEAVPVPETEPIPESKLESEPPSTETGGEADEEQEVQEQKDNSSEDEHTSPPKEAPPKKSKKSKKKSKKSAAAKEASKISTSTNHINDDTNTMEKEKASDQVKEAGEDQKV